jgi:hypothetical protein
MRWSESPPVARQLRVVRLERCRASDWMRSHGLIERLRRATAIGGSVRNGGCRRTRLSRIPLPNQRCRISSGNQPGSLEPNHAHSSLSCHSCISVVLPGGNRDFMGSLTANSTIRLEGLDLQLAVRSAPRRDAIRLAATAATWDCRTPRRLSAPLSWAGSGLRRRRAYDRRAPSSVDPRGRSSSAPARHQWPCS